jgi:hypothetical protein
MRYLIIFSGLVFTLIFSGCASVQPIPENTPSIVIKKPEHRSFGLGRSFDFPAGVYVPDFKTEEGTYYLAPTKLVVNALGIHRPRRGGLFIPNPDQKITKTTITTFDRNGEKKTGTSVDLRQAGWLDQEDDSSILSAGLTSSTGLWHFDEPILYEIQNHP